MLSCPVITFTILMNTYTPLLSAILAQKWIYLQQGYCITHLPYPVLLCPFSASWWVLEIHRNLNNAKSNNIFRLYSSSPTLPSVRIPVASSDDKLLWRKSCLNLLSSFFLKEKVPLWLHKKRIYCTKVVCKCHIIQFAHNILCLLWQSHHLYYTYQAYVYIAIHNNPLNYCRDSE